ncbi:MAG: thiamine-phosphate kinase [Proteobacteria bacterium]|nr:thiamine-phosphate kinase [Pseudomonadota bacterium]
MAEFDLIERIRARCNVSRDDVILGIGDDAALLEVPAGHALAVSTDTLVADVHFPLEAAAFDVGWKALAVNLSDLAAMGAEPAWATLALTLPAADAAWVDGFAEGFAALARQHRVALIGGDTTQGPLSITVTIQGFVRADVALRRSGARVGDAVFVSGTLGDAAAALRKTQSGSACDPRLLDRLHRPTPRVGLGMALRGRASACIDVSDGLVADLGHICAASGAGAQIDADALPASTALREVFDAPTRRGFQLAGGDDYELCFTAAQADLACMAGDDCPIKCIGRIVAGEGVSVRDAQGRAIDVPRAGWEHFA